MINNFRNKITAQAGFTLIETLLAILILAVALTGPLTIAAKSLSSALIAKDQTVAFFLAQDAVEYIRYKRDTNTLSGASWSDAFGVAGSCTSGAGCRVDSVKDTIVSCGSACPKLNYDNTNHWYTYDAVTSDGPPPTIAPTPFTRSILVKSVANNGSELNVTVSVSWKDTGGALRSVVVHENLTNWQ